MAADAEAGLDMLPQFSAIGGKMRLWSIEIEDHIDYFTVGIDPGKITPLK
jgi:hypothetical protein